MTKQINSDIIRLLIEEYYIRALDWIWQTTNDARPIKLSKVAIAQCGLVHLSNVDKKDEFCIGILRGFGSLLTLQAKNKFARELLMWSDIYIPNEIKSEFAFYNGFRDTVEIYDDDAYVDVDFVGQNTFNAGSSDGGGADSSSAIVNRSVLIKTANVKVNLDILRTFLKSEEKIHFLLYGPAGCGKT